MAYDEKAKTLEEAMEMYFTIEKEATISAYLLSKQEEDPKPAGGMLAKFFDAHEMENRSEDNTERLRESAKEKKRAANAAREWLSWAYGHDFAYDYSNERLSHDIDEAAGIYKERMSDLGAQD